VIVDWTDEFDRWLTHAEEQGGRLLAVATALLQELNDLPARPAEETATFKLVRQARRHELWRAAHPFDPAVAVRIICWFPSDEEVVIALVGFDKKAIGDVSTQARRYAARRWSTPGCGRREAPMSEEVKFIRGNDRINQLAQRPDIAAEVAQVRAEMAEADRTYAMGLAALRQAAELTQVELARRLGVTQAAISRMEQPHDLLLSTLNAYLQAIGGTARMVVSFADGHETTLDLSRLA
jgi:DNA-binding transcriptional regulator YiaG